VQFLQYHNNYLDYYAKLPKNLKKCTDFKQVEDYVRYMYGRKTELHHVKAHTDNQDEHSKGNRLADYICRLLLMEKEPYWISIFNSKTKNITGKIDILSNPSPSNYLIPYLKIINKESIALAERNMKTFELEKNFKLKESQMREGLNETYIKSNIRKSLVKEYIKQFRTKFLKDFYKECISHTISKRPESPTDLFNQINVL